MVAEARCDARVVRRTVTDVVVAAVAHRIIERQEVDRDVGPDVRLTGVQRHGADRQICHAGQVIAGVGRLEELRGVPHAAGKHLSPRVDRRAAGAGTRGSNAAVARVAQCGAAGLEAKAQLRLARHQHRDAVTHALAVLVLAAAAAAHHMVPILVPCHGTESRVVAATAGGVEVDRAAVVERVAGARNAVVDRHAGLGGDRRERRTRRKHQIAHAVGSDVGVHLGQVVLVAGGVVRERAGGAIRHALRGHREQRGLVVDHREVSTAHRRGDRLRAGAAVGVGQLAGRVGVVGGAADRGLGVGHGHGGGCGACRGLGSRRGDRVDLRRGGALIDHAFLIQHDAGVGVHHELDLLVLGRIDATFTRGGHEFHAQLGLHGFGVHARPHHEARRGDLWSVDEVAHGVAAVGGHFQIGGIQIAVSHAAREVAQVLQRAARQHHGEIALVADQAPDVAAEHRHATHLLAPVHRREVGAVFLGSAQRQDVRAVTEGADGHQLRERNAPQRAPLLHEGLGAVVRRVAPRELATPHATQVGSVLQQRAARECLIKPFANRQRIGATIVGGCGAKTALVG